MAASRFVINSAIVFVVVTVCYFNSLNCGFVFDDASAIKDNKDLRPTTPMYKLFQNDFWGTPMYKEKSHKSYRPLCVLTFRLNYALSELEPMTYHLVNMLLHGMVCVVYLAVCKVFFTETVSFIAALLFAVHPIHTEAVTGVVGRAELLSSIFLLLAFLCFSKNTGKDKPINWSSLFGTIVLVVIATLCKEQGITVIGICCIYEVFFAQEMTVLQILHLARQVLSGKPHLPSHFQKAILRCVFLVFSTLALLVARVKVMAAELPVFTKFDNPAAVSTFPTKQLTFSYLLPVNVWLLLCPSRLLCDWTMGTVPLVTSILDPRNLATISLIAVLLKFIFFAVCDETKRSKQVIMCLAFLVLPFIPASNLFFPVGFVVAERILYVPSMGFCMAVALGIQLIAKHKNFKKLVYVGLAFLILLHSAKTYKRNFDWESENTIFSAAVRVVKTNAKCWNNVGHSLENQEKWGEALEYFKHASEVQPDDIGAWLNVGRAYKNLNKTKEAEVAYKTAMDLMPPVIPGKKYTTRVAPNHLNVYLNLANLIKDDASRLVEADNLYKKAITMRPDFIEAYINRGDVLLKLNRSQEAVDNYMTALKYEDDNADIYYNLGVIYTEKGERSLALRSFEKALTLNSEHRQSLFNSAVLMQETENPALRPEAISRLNQLLSLDFTNEKVYFNLGMLEMDNKNYETAKMWFDKAIELKEDFRSALFNLALMLTQINRDIEALPYLDNLMKYHPNHSKGLILLGDIYMNKIKSLKDAKKCYEKILEVDPQNIQARHNLCVVYVEEGNLVKAEKCLSSVSEMAPAEEYIKKHLNIVRARLYQQYQKQRQEQLSDQQIQNQQPSQQQQKQQSQQQQQQQQKEQRQPQQQQQQQQQHQNHENQQQQQQQQHQANKANQHHKQQEKQSNKQR
ncbi:protein O-mannosyl-transferase TMTC3-like [Ptychodera flava]|uniref:protein O-mannosyl-transferase TMTC3-like n=1 Tax=Ptychodera flava TaxID=63121 RepID=UPI00396A8D1D